jgi:hypothetical protein
MTDIPFALPAAEDNIVTIAKYRARRAALQEEIQRLKGLAPTERVHEPQGVALPDVQRTADQQQGNSALPTPSTSPPAVAAAAAAAATTTATASATPVGQQQQQQQQHTPLEHIPPQPALEDSSRGHAEEEQAGTGVWL